MSEKISKTSNRLRNNLGRSITFPVFRLKMSKNLRWKKKKTGKKGIKKRRLERPLPSTDGFTALAAGARVANSTARCTRIQIHVSGDTQVPPRKITTQNSRIWFQDPFMTVLGDHDEGRHEKTGQQDNIKRHSQQIYWTATSGTDRWSKIILSREPCTKIFRINLGSTRKFAISF